MGSLEDPRVPFTPERLHQATLANSSSLSYACEDFREEALQLESAPGWLRNHITRVAKQYKAPCPDVGLCRAVDDNAGRVLLMRKLLQRFLTAPIGGIGVTKEAIKSGDALVCFHGVGSCRIPETEDSVIRKLIIAFVGWQNLSNAGKRSVFVECQPALMDDGVCVGANVLEQAHACISVI